MVMQKNLSHKNTSGFTLIEFMTLSTYISACIHSECCWAASVLSCSWPASLASACANSDTWRRRKTI